MNNLRILHTNIVPYLKTLATIVLVTIIGWPMRETLGPVNLEMFYLLVVVLIAVCWGRGPAIMTSAAVVLVFDYFFSPAHSPANGFDLQSVFMFIGFLVVGVLVSALTSKTRQQAAEAHERETQVTMLYHLSKDLAAADSFDEVLHVIRVNVGKIFNCHVAVFLAAETKLELKSFDQEFPNTNAEISAAHWAFENDRPSGPGTNNHKEARAQYLPLKTSQGVFGVLGVAFKETVPSRDAKDDYILSALVNQAAIAIQRTRLSEVSRQMDLMRETEKLQTALLNSISHDLRTPLVSIMGVLDSLLHDSSSLDQQTREELLATAYEDSDHLNRLVSNLLDMTRLEAKALKIHIEPCELRDVVGSSLQSLKEEIERRNIIISIPEDLPEIPMDFVLMMRVFINLVDNAVKYSRPETPIEITAGSRGDTVTIDVKDNGIGIPKEDLVRVFDKFYRAVKPRKITGTGLGLSICKGIVEVHGGEISARNNPDQGVTISIILPIRPKRETNGQRTKHEDPDC